MCNLSKFISVVETTPYIHNKNERKRNLPTVNQIADDYNNPYFDSINYQVVITTKRPKVFGGMYV